MKTIKAIVRCGNRILAAVGPGAKGCCFSIPEFLEDAMFIVDSDSVRRELLDQTGIDVTEALVIEKDEFMIFDLSIMQNPPDHSSTFPHGLSWVTLGALQECYSCCSPSLQRFLDSINATPVYWSKEYVEFMEGRCE